MPVCLIQLNLVSVLATRSRMALWFMTYKGSVATQVHTLGCGEAHPSPNHHPLKNKKGGLSRTLPAQSLPLLEPHGTSVPLMLFSFPQKCDGLRCLS